jgi:hypothetical protein
MKRIIALAAALAATLVLALPATAEAAPAVLRHHAAEIRNWRSGRCLTAAPSGRAALRPCTGARSQRWHVRGREIVASSGLCLTVIPSGAGRLLACGHRNQRWIRYGQEIRSMFYPGECLYPHRGRAVTWPCSMALVPSAWWHRLGA